MLKRVAVKIPTAHRTDFIDLTPLLEDAVAKSQVYEGITHVLVRHTSCSLAVQEWEPNLIHDFHTFLGQFASDNPETPAWLHNQLWRRPDVPPGEPQNAGAHIKALFMGNSRAVPVVGGQPDLGRWQRVILVEMDGPREREVLFMVQGDGVQDGLRAYWQEQAQMIEAAIEPYLRSRFEGPMLESSRYLTKGGKRLRGVLALLICEVLGGDPDRALSRSGSVLRGWSHLNPTPLRARKPRSIQDLSPYQATASRWTGMSMRSTQGSFWSTSHMTISVPNRCIPLALKAVPLPIQAWPGPGMRYRATFLQPPTGWKSVFLFSRISGCHPNPRMAFHNRGLHSPRSVITTTSMSTPTAGARAVSNWTNGSIHGPFLLAGKMRHATGMAQPRYSTLTTSLPEG